MPFATDFQYGGNPYLGLGVILLILFIFVYKTANRGKQNWKEFLKEGLTPYILGIILFFLLLSLSPTITFNQYKIFSYPIFILIEGIWSIFRSTDRFTWPIVYIVIAICIWWTITRFSVKKSIFVLCAVLLIQWVDLEPWLISKGDTFKTRVTWQTGLPSSAWKNLANDYKHILFAGGGTRINSFLDLAANNKMTVSDAYLARNNRIKIDENIENELAYLLNNGPRDDIIYIFRNEEQAFLYKESGIHFFSIDGLLIGINSNKVYLDNYEYN
jgi:hypothetical protein